MAAASRSRCTAPPKCGPTCNARASRWPAAPSSASCGHTAGVGSPAARRSAPPWRIRPRRAADLVSRQFRVPAPNVLLVADFTYVRLSGGAFVYTAFAIDAYAGRIVGWTCSASKQDRFVRQAIRHAAQLRVNEGNPLLGNTIHHSDAGSQYTSVRFGETLALSGSCPRSARSGTPSTTPWPRRR